MHLLERDPYLEQLHRYAGYAREGTGQLVFVGGEMGIGKTSLIEQFRTELESSTHIELVSCDALMVKGPLGPLMDIAQILGPEVSRLLASQAPREQLFRAVEEAFGRISGFLVLIGEDLHAGDEASLDLLHFLGRRIEKLKVLFIATYRDDEIPATHPLRRVLGNLATAPNVRRILLPALSLAAVQELAGGQNIDPEVLWDYTAGNPFFVREILDAGTNAPVTIQDAVLARASRLSPGAREVLDASSLIGLAVDPVLLEAVIAGPVEPLIDECLALGLFRSTGTAMQFRHAAVRDAVLTSISAIRRILIHKRIYAALLANGGTDSARLAHHAEESANGVAAYRHAVDAALLAIQYKSHREAAAQYARALRHAGDQPTAVRADLLEANAYEWYLTGRNDDALTAQQQAVTIRASIKTPESLGESIRKLSRYWWFAGNSAVAERYARQALEVLADQPESRAMARSYSNLSQLRMLAQDVDDATHWGRLAIDLSERLGDNATLVHALTNVGAALGYLGGRDGHPLLHRAIAIGKAHDMDDDLARAYTCLGGTEWYQRNLSAAMECYSDGIALSESRDLLAMELYMHAMRANVRLMLGEFKEANREAGAVRTHQLAGKPALFVALIALGLAKARQGGDGSAELDEALQLATGIGELQRVGPVRASRAEAAWLANDLPAVAREASAAFDLACEGRDPWVAGELALWLHRTGVPPLSAAVRTVAEPYRLEIEGDWRAAAAIWNEKGAILNEARALSWATDEETLRNALGTLDRLGFRADAARVATRLRHLGYRQVRRGPRPDTLATFAMLTPRELDVLRRVSVSATNREIARDLYLSPRTVEHHVSAILAKLEVSSREDAARRALEAGITV